MTGNWKTLLEENVLQALESRPAGMSEYELLQQLRDSHHQQFRDTDYHDQHALFNIHFMLFHILYRLRGKLLDEGGRYLDICPLKIRILPCRETSSSELSEHDPLQEYYLNLDNMEQTDAAGVEAMLQDFWQRFLGNGQRERALKILGLEDPVEESAIRRRYRRLVMQHHPDRGGNTADLQALNAALACLLPERKSSTAGD